MAWTLAGRLRFFNFSTRFRALDSSAKVPACTVHDLPSANCLGLVAADFFGLVPELAAAEVADFLVGVSVALAAGAVLLVVVDVAVLAVFVSALASDLRELLGAGSGRLRDSVTVGFAFGLAG